MKAIILMAGDGSRFRSAGYTDPKPFINVRGKPMVQWVIDSLPPCSEYIFCIRKEHEDLMYQLRLPAASLIVTVDKTTEGAACTALLAKDFINNYEDIIVANSDQYVEYDRENFEVLKNRVEGVVFAFKATDPKWSFLELDVCFDVCRVEEKNPISDVATCGIYWYRSGKLLIHAIESMIEKNIRTNNEFYLAPSYNEIVDTETVVPFFVHKMQGLGTPKDLEEFING